MQNNCIFSTCKQIKKTSNNFYNFSRSWQGQLGHQSFNRKLIVLCFPSLFIGNSAGRQPSHPKGSIEDLPPGTKQSCDTQLTQRSLCCNYRFVLRYYIVLNSLMGKNKKVTPKRVHYRWSFNN